MANLGKNEEKMRNKADALAEYYRQLDAKMKENFDAHQKLAYNPGQDKLARLTRIEDKNHEDFLKKQAQNEDNTYLNRLKNNQILVAENDKMKKNKEYQQELERMKMMEDDLIAKGEKNAYQLGQEMSLEEENKKKNLYRQTLLYQQAMNVKK